MANKTLFASLKSLLPRTTVRNEAGGPAYLLEPKHALACDKTASRSDRNAALRECGGSEGRMRPVRRIRPRRR